jgi:molybdopterin-guanine dinucleotide biosynthesis protein A
MGADKALVELCGEPLVVHALRILHHAGLSVSIVGGRSSLDAFAPVVADIEPDRGPLTGVTSALAELSSRIAVFIPIDMPLLPPSLVTLLLHHAVKTGAPVTLASVGGFAQTFPAVVHRRCLPALQRELARAQGGCFAAFQEAANALSESVAVLTIETALQDGYISEPRLLPLDCWFLNVNTVEDLNTATALLHG